MEFFDHHTLGPSRGRPAEPAAQCDVVLDEIGVDGDGGGGAGSG